MKMNITKKKMALVALALTLCVGIVSAAVLIYYGQIITTVNVKQAVLLDGNDYTTPITKTVNVSGGDSYWCLHYLQSQTSVPVNLLLETSYYPLLTDSEIITTYHFANASTVIKTADRLVALQNSSDAGWDWIVTNATAHSGSVSATNIYGVTALGLLEAYKLTGNSSYLDAAKKVADFMKYGDPTRGDFYNGHDGYGWGYSFDYKFLMEFSALYGDPSYASYALAAWNWQRTNRPVYANGNQTAFFEHFVSGWINNYGIAGWGASDYGLMALQMGDTVWARALAVVINNNLTNIINGTTIGGASQYKDLGMAWTLKFLVAVDPATYTSSITTLETNLKNDQLSGGSWDDGNPEGDAQTTAYVVMGLCAAGEGTAAQKGINWLVANQQSNGGWLAESKEYSETDSEAIQALPIALTQVTLLPHERLDFYICYNFAVNIFPYTYTITTTVKPAP